MEEKQFIRENPWRGLSSYGEGDVLYGRDDDIRDLSQSVLRDRYTLLYGKSGIGKSSILNAAIIPTLRRHGYTPIVIRLSHEKLDYLQQIHEAIVDVLKKGVCEMFPRQGQEETLYEYLHRHMFWNVDGSRSKLFLMFDQFEEIFTLQSDLSRKKEFFRELADQCNDIKPNYLQPSAMQKEPTVSATDLNDEFELPDLKTVDYIEDNDIRMIFTIREDSLSEFDYYASSIPILRSNRYYLRPINEEQAAQIIMRPCPRLVNEQDAWLIISKVTKRTDFKIDGKPELTVDATILSLYLSKLYEARKEEGHITTNLIEKRGDEIIYNFYKDAISSVSLEAVEYLESKLLTREGRRNIIAKKDVIDEKHVSEKELQVLIEEKKILHQFDHAGAMRIELIHDILCPVVLQHIEERKARAWKEAEERKMASLKKRNRILLLVLLFGLLGGMGSLLYWFVRPDSLMSEAKKIPIAFQEDESVGMANGFWRANLLIVGVTPWGKDTIENREVNDRFKDSTLFIVLDSVKRVNIKLTFGKGKFADIDTTVSVQDVCDNPLILLTIHKKQPQLFRYYGRAATMIEGMDIPLQNAVVIVRDKVMHTDDGNFVIELENQINDNDLICIVKEGFAVFEKKAKELLRDNNLIEPCYLAMEEEQFSVFEKQCNEMDSLLQDKNSTWEYWISMYRNNKGFRFVPIDSTKGKDNIVIAARSVKGKKNAERMNIQGVYYYSSEYKKFNAMGHPHYAYRIFTGYMDIGRLDKVTLPEKHFELESVNFVNSRQIIYGEFKYTGDAYGEVRNAKGLIGYFGK